MRAGLSQVELARRLGMNNRQQLCDIEAGRRAPGEALAARICRLIRCSEAQFWAAYGRRARG